MFMAPQNLNMSVVLSAGRTQAAATSDDPSAILRVTYAYTAGLAREQCLLNRDMLLAPASSAMT